MLATGAIVQVLGRVTAADVLPLAPVRLMPYQPNADLARLFVEIAAAPTTPVSVTLGLVVVLGTQAGGVQGQYLDTVTAVFNGTADATGFCRLTDEIEVPAVLQWGLAVTALTGAGAIVNVYAMRGASTRL